MPQTRHGFLPRRREGQQGAPEVHRNGILRREAWQGREAPYVIVGKGITFDSGGISIKPVEGMEKMKYDMAGAAAVIAAIRCVAALKLPLDLIAIAPCSENMPGGAALKPGDVVRAINGKTIEIISTDAEGRLVLADALCYAQKYKPRAVIDIATLTGACVIALGDLAIGLMGNDRALIDAVRDAGEAVNERAWELPMWDEFLDAMKGDVTDLKNVGGQEGRDGYRREDSSRSSSITRGYIWTSPGPRGRKRASHTAPRARRPWAFVCSSNF